MITFVHCLLIGSGRRGPTNRCSCTRPKQENAIL